MQEPDFYAAVSGLLDAPCPTVQDGLPDTFSLLQILVEELGLDAVAKAVR